MKLTSFVRLFLPLFFPLICFLQAAAAQDANTLQKRLDELERRQRDIEFRQTEIYAQSQEGAGKVNSFLGNQIRLGGFYETALTSLSGPDMQSQMAANNNTIGLNISSEFGNKMSFVSQILTGLAFPLQNPHNNPALIFTRLGFASANVFIAAVNSA